MTTTITFPTMRQIIDLFESASSDDQPMDFVEVCEALGVHQEDAKAWERLDGKYPADFKLWQEHNDRAAMQRILDQPEVPLVSRIALAFQQATKGKPKNMLPMASVNEMRMALAGTINVFRGGGGVYDPVLNRPWYSFTTHRQRAEGIYAKFPTWNNFATHVRHLPQNDHHWVVRVSVPIMRILYFNRLNEGEVVLSAEDAATAKVIVQT